VAEQASEAAPCTVTVPSSRRRSGECNSRARSLGGEGEGVGPARRDASGIEETVGGAAGAAGRRVIGAALVGPYHGVADGDGDGLGLKLLSLMATLIVAAWMAGPRKRIRRRGPRSVGGTELGIAEWVHGQSP